MKKKQSRDDPQVSRLFHFQRPVTCPLSPFTFSQLPLPSAAAYWLLTNFLPVLISKLDRIVTILTKKPNKLDKVALTLPKTFATLSKTRLVLHKTAPTLYKKTVFLSKTEAILDQIIVLVRSPSIQLNPKKSMAECSAPRKHHIRPPSREPSKMETLSLSLDFEFAQFCNKLAKTHKNLKTPRNDNWRTKI